MQIASLTNVLASSPAALALNAAAQGGAPATTNGLPGQNTGSLADALITQSGTPGQFAGLLSGANIKVSALGDTDSKDTPPGDVASSTTPQTGSIAVPPIGLFIDQQPNQNVVLTNSGDAVSDATSGGAKKLIFADDKLAPAASSLLANEVDGKKGDIKLAELEKNKAAQDPEFAKAFANIVQQAKDKGTAAKTQIQAKVTEAKTDFINKTATADKSEITSALNQPQSIAGKIAAKVLGVKDEKVESDTDLTADMSAKLQDLDAQLRTKNYTQIKAATANLEQSPVDQVQLKITQAAASGLNNIKINLHPAELGSVDVDMDVDHQGNTKIRIIADKADTLQLLKQDSSHLVKSLSEIGVKADAGSLQFSLRGDQQNQQNFANAQTNMGNGGQQQNQQQQAAAASGTYSRFSNINEQDLILSINNKALNILV